MSDIAPIAQARPSIKKRALLAVALMFASVAGGSLGLGPVTSNAPTAQVHQQPASRLAFAGNGEPPACNIYDSYTCSLASRPVQFIAAPYNSGWGCFYACYSGWYGGGICAGACPAGKVHFAWGDYGWCINSEAWMHGGGFNNYGSLMGRFGGHPEALAAAWIVATQGGGNAWADRDIAGAVWHFANRVDYSGSNAIANAAWGWAMSKWNASRTYISVNNVNLATGNAATIQAWSDSGENINIYVDGNFYGTVANGGSITTYWGNGNRGNHSVAAWSPVSYLDATTIGNGTQDFVLQGAWWYTARWISSGATFNVDGPINQLNSAVANLRTGQWTWGGNPTASVPANPGDPLRWDMYYSNQDGQYASSAGYISTDMTGNWGSLNYLTNVANLPCDTWGYPCQGGGVNMGIARWDVPGLAPGGQWYYKGFTGNAPATADFNNGSNTLPICSWPYYQSNWGVYGQWRSDWGSPGNQNEACADVAYTPGESVAKTFTANAAGAGTSNNPYLVNPNAPIPVHYSLSMASTGNRNLPDAMLIDSLGTTGWGGSGSFGHLQNVTVTSTGGGQYWQIDPSNWSFNSGCRSSADCYVEFYGKDVPAGQTWTAQFDAAIPACPINVQCYDINGNAWIKPGQTVRMDNNVDGYVWLPGLPYPDSASSSMYVNDPCPVMTPNVSVVPVNRFNSGSVQTWEVTVKNQTSDLVGGVTTFDSPGPDNGTGGRGAPYTTITGFSSPSTSATAGAINNGAPTSGGVGQTSIGFNLGTMAPGEQRTYTVTVQLPSTPAAVTQYIAVAHFAINDLTWTLCTLDPANPASWATSTALGPTPLTPRPTSE